MTKLIVLCIIFKGIKTGKIMGILLNTWACLSADFELCSKLKQKYGWYFRLHKEHNSHIFIGIKMNRFVSI